MSTALIVGIYGAAFVGFFGSLFVIGSLIVSGRADDAAAPGALKRHEAADDLVDQLAHGDIPALPSASFPFHREGL